MMSQKKQNKCKRGFISVGSAVSLIVIGAGITAAGILFLKDEHNRNKVKEEFTNVKDRVVEYVDGIKNQVQDKAVEVEKKLAKV